MNTYTSLHPFAPSATSTFHKELSIVPQSFYLSPEEELADESWYKAPTPRYNPRTINKLKVEHSRKKEKLARKARRKNREK
jgi:hypothetical protein